MSVLNVLGVTALPGLFFYMNEREFGEERVGKKLTKMCTHKEREF